MYRIVETSYCTLETNITMYVDHTSIKNKNKHKMYIHSGTKGSMTPLVYQWIKAELGA